MSAMLVADLGLGHVRIPEVQSPAVLGGGAEYGAPAGAPLLREAVATWEKVRAEDVAITTGASLGLVATLAALPRPCSILCPRPHYPSYPRLAEAMGIELIYYELGAETAWNPRIETISRLIRDDTQAILWNFPSNPIGCLPGRDVLAGMREVVQGSNLAVISDEVYADFLYDRAQFPDMRELFGSESVVRLRSFSKVFGMPGERLGYVIADPPRLEAIWRAHWALAMSPPATAQAIALCLLRSDPERRLLEVRQVLAEHRAYAVSVLSGCSRVNLVVPQAGMFCWFEVIDWPGNSRALARACASEAGVVVMPGSTFGVDTPAYLRVSFAVPRDELIRGLGALVNFLDNI
jgi:aminotransferase